MGITGELVRSVFSKSRSIRTHETNVRSNLERRRWKSSVRSYLCGDEFNSVLAEEDSASLRSSNKVTVFTQPEFSSLYAEEDPASSVWSSEATVTQPMPEDLIEKTDAESKQHDGDIQEEKHNSTSKLFRKDDAAIVIQSALRSFLARRRKEGINLIGKEEIDVGAKSQRSESVGTSIEVQTGNSTVHSLPEGNESLLQRLQHKGRPQVLKLKEDWDDSTVSSNISKLRMQNRLEATTRRERALAYAFSQQLRVCSKKKHTRSESDIVESNMGWNWLERWMATRQQENCLIDITISNQKSAARKRLLFDVAGEMESCGSNEVSIQLDNISVSAFSKGKEECINPLQDRLKPTSVSKCKTLPSYHYPTENIKVIKKDFAGEDEMDKKHSKPKQPWGNKREAECEYATSKVSPEL